MPTRTTDPIAVAVLARMNARHITTCKLADLSDVHRNVMSRWLAGKRTISLSQLHRVCAVLGLSLAIVESREARHEINHHRTD